MRRPRGHTFVFLFQYNQIVNTIVQRGVESLFVLSLCGDCARKFRL